MAHSPHDVAFIDLTVDTNGEEERDQFLGNDHPPTTTGTKHKRNHGSLKTTGLDKNESGRSIICFDDSSDDEEFVTKTPPTFKKFKPDESADHVKIEIKKEGEKPVARISIAEDGLEIVERAVSKMVPVSSSAYRTNDDDDDVVFEGVANELRLPHLRQDCTNWSFKEFRIFNKYSLSPSEIPIEYLDSNEKSCDLCYCFVCDCPVKDCKKWRSAVSRVANLNHCCAINSVALWENFRKEERRTQTSPSAASAVSLASPTATAAPPTGGSSISEDVKVPPPPGYHFMNSCPVDGCAQCWCFVCDAERYDCDRKYGHRLAYNSPHWQLERKLRKLSTYGRTGPFAPDTADASQDPQMKQCRKCSWYFRRQRDYPRMDFFYEDEDQSMCYDDEDEDWDWSSCCSKQHEKPLTNFSDDWCPYCGRVALDEDFSKRQSKFRNAEDFKEWFAFGEKIIPFRVHAHDPRLIDPYKANWDKNPEWLYDEADRQEEVFLHLVGERPNLNNVFDRLASSTEDGIPKTTNIHRRDDLDGIILEDLGDINLIHCLSCSFCLDYVDTSASWDRQLGAGVLKIRLVFPKSFLFGKKADNSSQCFQTLLPGILALWFGLKLDIGDLSCRMEVSINNFNSRLELFKNSYDEINKCKDAILQFVKSKAEEIRASHASYSDSLSLCSSLRDGGGVSTSDTSMKACFTSFYREQLPNYLMVPRYDGETFAYLVDLFKGQIRSKRSPGYKDHMGPIVALCGSTDATVAKVLLQQKPGAPSERFSISEMMGCLENLGHESEVFVEGLDVELLDFQKQALKWAIEREQIPGGIQSFYWPKLPSREGEQGDLYFNPVLNQFRKDKPALARGGILAAEMGLGKTLISLSLILKNPAPAFPNACSPISLLTSAPKPSTGDGWDETLYDRTSSQNSKRGSIISRGTLVICPVSLVGQWIEEAKSRLSNPHLIYPYHGQNRKRDAKELAEAAIVVTTYQVLGSDNSYHRKKAGAGYCAPLEQVRWWRIIADEGHTLRESYTKKSQAVLALVADNKWVVTGTPISTDPKDVKNLFDFLGIEESSKMFVQARRTVSRRQRVDTKLGLLMFLLRPVLLRYSQNQKYRKTGTTLMSLPPMSKRTIDVEFSSGERREFDKLEKAAQEFYLDFRHRHFKDMSMHFLKVSSKLMPLRVASAGGKYPLSDTLDESSDDCENTHYDQDKTDDVAADGEESEPRSSKKKKVARYSDFVFTSKANVVLAELKRIRDNETDSKSLIFSQFPSTLEHLQELLPAHGFSFRTLKGSMSMKQRAKALHDFQNDPPTTVFLLSMRSGAVGINLTQANRVFLMEPGFNPALEAQAIGRVHRLGQKRNVEICRLVIKDSFESRMVGFMKKKYKLSFDDVESDKTKSNGSGDNEIDSDGDSEKDTKAAVQAIVGNLQTDRAQVLTEEFDELFGVQDLLARYAAEQVQSMDGDSFSPDAAMSGCV